MKNKMAVLLILLSFMFSFSAYADNVNKATPSEAVKKPVHTIEVDSFCYDPDFELEYLDETGNIAYRSFYGNDGTYYLYLPIGTDISSIQPVCSMEIKDASGCEFYEDIITDIYDENLIIVTNKGAFSVNVLSSDLPSVSLRLEGVSLSEIESGSKDTKYKGNTVFIRQDGDDIIEDNNTEVKGRGNFSWTLDKKGFQLKLSSKKNILKMGKAKTWLLIADHGDASLIRNRLALETADAIGMPFTSKNKYVDLWIDGDYRGNYLLCEKVQVGDNRVELEDDHGIIAELDNNYYASELNWFGSQISGTHFVLKDSVADDEGEENSVSEKDFSNFRAYVNEFEKALYANAKDWEKISSMIDAESFVKFYFIQEFTENADGCRSSVYLYRDGADDVLHMGPVWDFDLSTGNCCTEEYGGDPRIDFIMHAHDYTDKSCSWFEQLFKIPEFRNLAVSIYKEVINGQLNNASEIINEAENYIGKSAEMNFRRWDILGGENLFGSYRGHRYAESFSGEVDYLRRWVEERTAYLNERYLNGFVAEDDVQCIPDIPANSVVYRSHVSDIGWMDTVYNGRTSGNQDTRMEAIKIKLQNNTIDGRIRYNTFVQGSGWQGWAADGSQSGTTGLAKAIFGFKAELTGDIADSYSIEYRTYIHNEGWKPWVRNGELSGYEGGSNYIAAVEIRLVDKAPHLYVTPHFSNIGWMDTVKDGEMIGKHSSNEQLEAFTAYIQDFPADSGFEYRAFAQNNGWDSWKKNGETTGTTGLSKALYAFEMKLTGKAALDYTIEYRAYVDGEGWSGWFKDGETCGNDSSKKKILSVETRLVEKKIQEEPGEEEEPKEQGEEETPGEQGEEEIPGEQGEEEPPEQKPEEEIHAISGIIYSPHYSNIGWMDYVENGATAGIVSRNEHLEALIVDLKDCNVSGTVQYRSYAEGKGWLPWVIGGSTSGTVGEARPLNAVELRLTGEISKYFRIKYRAYFRSSGWSEWVYDGDVLGSPENRSIITGYEIELESKIKADEKESVYANVSYMPHYSNIGWMDFVSDGKSAGSSGKREKLEAIRIILDGSTAEGSVKYRSFVEGLGWQDWVADGVESGTTGLAKSVLALEMKLDGEIAESYSIEYRAYISENGWTEWLSDGAQLGNEASGKTIYELQIRLKKRK